MKISLITGQEFIGESFGAEAESYGELVFNTGVTGYELTLTDPSYKDQIIVFTQPLIGNYGIPNDDRDEGILKFFESEKIWAKGVIVSEYSTEYSHWNAVESLGLWLKQQGIPAITGVDTRAITKILRNQGSTLAGIIPDNAKLPKKMEDPNERNLAGECSCDEVIEYKPKNPTGKTVLVYDLGIKNNIIREFLNRGVRVLRAPFDAKAKDYKFDGLFLSNGPGDPRITGPYLVDSVNYAIKSKIPIFGICLGNQVLSLAIGGKIEKMPYGHRGINQPCIDLDTGKCYITSQNHGFHVKDGSLPKDWKVWWKNANDQTVEGIKHKSGLFRSIQFHPESAPGPEDTSYLFDEFVSGL